MLATGESINFPGWGFWVCIGVAAVIVIILAAFLIASIRRRGKGGRAPRKKIVASAYIEALGGADNIVSHNLVRSRIVLELRNYDLVDKDKLKEAGVDGFIMMSDKLTLVIKGDAEAVNKAIFPGE